MKPTEIIAADCKKRGVDSGKVLNYLAHKVHQKEAQVLHTDKSVLTLIFMPKNAAEMHLFSVDAPSSVIKAAKHFMSVVKQSDLHKVYVNTKRPEMLRLLRMIGANPQPSDIAGYTWMAKV